MGEPNSQLESALGRFQQEVVRWNRQINLVSRQDTLKRVAILIGQCRRAWQRLAESELSTWSEKEPVTYFDLGSGGGLPGFVWHLLQAERFRETRTVLVEPREKRAWFLERLRNVAPGLMLEVWNGRWGEGGKVAGGAGNTLVSLKALHLSDTEVLSGLAGLVAAGSDSEVVIARFYPADQAWTPELELTLAPLKECTEIGGMHFKPCGSRILPPENISVDEASLVVCRYVASPNPL